MPGCARVHPLIMREQEEYNLDIVSGCLRFTGKVTILLLTVELQIVCSCISHPLVLNNRWPFPFGNFILVSPPHRQA